MGVFYNLSLSIVRGYFKLFFKVEAEGLENISDLSPDDRVLITPNHLSLLDPPVLGATLPIKMGYMAKAELFKIPVFGSLIRALGAFPVNRGGGNGIAAIKTAIRLLQEGKRLIMFPEGTRAKTPGILGEGKPGAVMIALKAKAYILPIGIESEYKIGGRIKIRIGKLINLSEYYDVKTTGEDLKKITDEVLMPEIAKLAGAKPYGN